MVLTYLHFRILKFPCILWGSYGDSNRGNYRSNRKMGCLATIRDINKDIMIYNDRNNKSDRWVCLKEIKYGTYPYDGTFMWNLRETYWGLFHSIFRDPAGWLTGSDARGC
jgi:hypothetical protein